METNELTKEKTMKIQATNQIFLALIELTTKETSDLKSFHHKVRISLLSKRLAVQNGNLFTLTPLGVRFFEGAKLIKDNTFVMEMGESVTPENANNFMRWILDEAYHKSRGSRKQTVISKNILEIIENQDWSDHLNESFVDAADWQIAITAKTHADKITQEPVVETLIFKAVNGDKVVEVEFYCYAPCLCGCGLTPSKYGSIFRQGHDAKAKSMILKVVRGEAQFDTLPRQLVDSNFFRTVYEKATENDKE
jgi:hypothetical protein